MSAKNYYALKISYMPWKTQGRLKFTNFILRYFHKCSDYRTDRQLIIVKFQESHNPTRNPTIQHFYCPKKHNSVSKSINKFTDNQRNDSFSSGLKLLCILITRNISRIEADAVYLKYVELLFIYWCVLLLQVIMYWFISGWVRGIFIMASASAAISGSLDTSGFLSSSAQCSPHL